MSTWLLLNDLLFMHFDHTNIFYNYSDFFPFEESIDGGANAPIKMERTEHGGHLGYMFHQLSDNEKKRARSTSWMPTELSRFISHVHNYNEDSIKS